MRKTFSALWENLVCERSCDKKDESSKEILSQAMVRVNSSDPISGFVFRKNSLR